MLLSPSPRCIVIAVTGRNSHSGASDRSRLMARCRPVERVAGIEPASQAWKASALPLSYTRETPPRAYWVITGTHSAAHHRPVGQTGHLSEAGGFPPFPESGGGGWIRTNVGKTRQIYSLLPLTARPPLHGRSPRRPAMWRSGEGLSTGLREVIGVIGKNDLMP